MTYETLEESRQDGVPVSLFLIEYGEEGEKFFAYTDFDSGFAFEGKNYRPIAISRDKVESSGSLEKDELSISITPNSGLVDLYRNSPPSFPVRVTIYQGHYPGGLFRLFWSGRIVAVELGKKLAKVKAQPISTTMRRVGLRRNYQYGCPFVLYGTSCRADEARVKQTVATTAVAANYVDMAAGWNAGLATGKYNGGYISWIPPNQTGREIRTIYRASATRLVLGGERIFGLSVGDNIDILPGCNHQKSDCQDVHANIVNFGGQPYIPLDNPTELKNQFY